jgi:crossover junction endodeoxyribonuclease RuvC
MKTILGIDPGFGRMGFGCILVSPGKLEVLDYGIASTQKGIEFGQRLADIGKDVESLLDVHKPDVVAIEKLYFTKNEKTAMNVAEARGVIVYLCAKRGIQIYEFTPSQVKLAVGGSGTADKAGIMRIISEILKLKRTPKFDDAADALAIALAASGMR